MDQAAAGLKHGFYHPITLGRLRAARGSPYKPFPPKNTYLEFDFAGFHPPQDEDVRSAVKQTVEAHLSPPIKNMGVRGIRHAAKELVKWPAVYDDRALRMNLFNLYVFIEIGGTGGGCFRYMYARFLNEAAGVTGDK